MAGLTPRMEGFCQDYVQTGNATKAYKLNYTTENMKPDVVNVKASQLLAHAKISVRIKELQEEIKMQHDITIESLLRELEEARTVALTCETPQTSAAVSATMGKAKLTGLDKQVIELRGNMMIETRSIASIFEGAQQDDEEGDEEDDEA